MSPTKTLNAPHPFFVFGISIVGLEACRADTMKLTLPTKMDITLPICNDQSFNDCHADLSTMFYFCCI